MTALFSFKFEKDPVRIVEIDDDLWFVATDLAKVLGYKMAPHMVRMLDEDEVRIHNVDSNRGPREMSIVAESGMYVAVIRSRREEAKAFLRWLTREVLPTIRRTGRYELPGGEPPPVQALDLDPVRLAAGVSVVREARRLFGPMAARSLWVQVGLPPVTPESEGALDIDPFAAPLRAFLADKLETTIQQAAEGMGMTDIDWSTRYRIGKLLALWGWTGRNRKVAKGRTARVFTRPAVAASAMTIEQGDMQ